LPEDFFDHAFPDDVWNISTEDNWKQRLRSSFDGTMLCRRGTPLAAADQVLSSETY
jgi:hypothetical protein